MTFVKSKKLLMISLSAVCIGAFGLNYLSFSNSSNPQQINAKEQIAKGLHTIPLHFEANLGQVDPSVKFLTHASHNHLYFTTNEIVMALQDTSNSDSVLSVLKMKFLNADQNPILKGVNEIPSKSHYFIGNDSSKWISNIDHYSKIAYENIYPGIDAVFYGNPQKLEYDFIISPKANPHLISVEVEGTGGLHVDNEGNLHIKTLASQDLVMEKPIIYQWIENEKVFIEGSYSLLTNNQFSFSINDYDTSNILVIDPVFQYSTYLGGSGSDFGVDITTDGSGFAYIVGSTTSINFPTTVGGYQTSLAGIQNGFITKVNAEGTALIYSTYLGGSGSDSVNGIKIDGSHNAFLTGQTNSIDFPTTPGAYQLTHGGTAGYVGFVTQLNSTGSALNYSTYLGTLDSAGKNTFPYQLALDSSGNTYIAGYTNSTTHPTTIGAFQTSKLGITTANSAFVTKLNASGTALVYSTYLGASTNDTRAQDIALSTTGTAYITGFTSATNFPVTPGAYQITPGAGTVNNAFVTALDASGAALLYSTYLGGASVGDTEGQGIAVDSTDHAYVTGFTLTSTFPTTPSAFQTALTGTTNAFITKFNPTGTSLIFSTYFGAGTTTSASAIAVDSQNNPHLVGYTNSTSLPTTIDANQPALPVGALNSGFYTKLNALGTSLIYSTYIGGNQVTSVSSVALDPFDNAFITGLTTSSTFPVTVGAFQPTLMGTFDAFATYFEYQTPIYSPMPPIHLEAFERVNKFSAQKEYYQTIKWMAPLSGITPVAYKIYGDAALTNLLATIPASAPLEYVAHNRNPSLTYTYYIVSVSAQGMISLAAGVQISKQ